MWGACVLKRSDGKRKLIPFYGIVNSEKLPMPSNSWQAYAVLGLTTEMSRSAAAG